MSRVPRLASELDRLALAPYQVAGAPLNRCLLALVQAHAEGRLMADVAHPLDSTRFRLLAASASGLLLGVPAPLLELVCHWPNAMASVTQDWQLVRFSAANLRPANPGHPSPWPRPWPEPPGVLLRCDHPVVGWQVPRQGKAAPSAPGRSAADSGVALKAGLWSGVVTSVRGTSLRVDVVSAQSPCQVGDVTQNGRLVCGSTMFAPMALTVSQVVRDGPGGAWQLMARATAPTAEGLRSLRQARLHLASSKMLQG
jgi:hypothetical protein